jgi:hypothetical protein
MRYIITLLLLCSNIAWAERDHVVIPTDIHCFKYDVLIKQLKNRFGEEPVFIGKSGLDEGAVTMMFINQANSSYTVVTANRDVACVFDSGDDVIYRLPKSMQNNLM